jgi:TolB-like protein
MKGVSAQEKNYHRLPRVIANNGSAAPYAPGIYPLAHKRTIVSFCKTCGKLTAVFFFLGILFSCAGVPPAKAQSLHQTAPEAGQAGDPALPLEKAMEEAAAAIAQKLPPGAKIAVTDFQSESAGLSAYLMEELDFALLDRGLVVADRANLQALRRELNFQASGEVDDESAQALGKFLGAQYAVTGQFVLTGSAYRLRVITVQVENAVRMAASGFTVPNNRELQKLVETINAQTISTHGAGY